MNGCSVVVRFSWAMEKFRHLNGHVSRYFYM